MPLILLHKIRYLFSPQFLEVKVGTFLITL
jgi:hypothetical protein